MSSLRVIQTTTNQFIRKETVNILRSRRLLAALESKGLITYGEENSGQQMEWRVRFRRAPLTPLNPDNVSITFQPRDRWQIARLPWRGYQANDAHNKFEKLQNRGTAAIVKWIAKITPFLLADIRENFSEELYQNGDATGNTNRLHGLNSIFRKTYTLPTSGSASRRGIYTSGQTYAGLDMSLGYYGGSWTPSSTAWPTGKGDTEYDFWHPLIVNYAEDSAWDGGATTWLANCEEAMRYAIMAQNRNQQKTDLVLLDMDMHRIFKESIQAREQINTMRGNNNSLEIKLGWADAINFEGATVTWEYGVPDERLTATTNVGFGIALDPEIIQLCSMQSQLFFANMPDHDAAHLQDRFSVDFFGNMKCNPRGLFKLAPNEVLSD